MGVDLVPETASSSPINVISLKKEISQSKWLAQIERNNR